MNLFQYKNLLAIHGIAALVCGCAATEPMVAVDAPLPPPARNKVEATYDYTHTVNRKSNKVLARRMVVALVRFEEDRPLGDEKIPFGPGEASAPLPPSESADLEVQVENGGARAHVEGSAAYIKPSDMGLRSRATLKHELMESESFVVVERDRILDILREQSFGQTGYVHPAGTPETGKLMGVQYLLEGSVGRNEDLTFKDTIVAPPDYKESDPSLFDKMFSSSPGAVRKRMHALRERQKRWAQAHSEQESNPIGVYLNLYSAKTGELVVSVYGIGATRQAAIRDGVDELVDKCRDLVNPPTVVAIDGQRVVIDSGAVDGVQVGQRFRYLTVGDAVSNSAGQAIGKLEDEGGELEVTSVHELMSITRVTRQVASPAIGGRVEPLH